MTVMTVNSDDSDNSDNSDAMTVMTVNSDNSDAGEDDFSAKSAFPQVYTEVSLHSIWAQVNHAGYANRNHNRSCERLDPGSVSLSLHSPFYP